MSKYIRTIYKNIVPSEELTTYNDMCHLNKYGFMHYVVKQADTIKELCDKFVLMGISVIILNEDNTQYRFEGKSEWFDITDIEIRTGVYGAIWKLKGLINVARLNDKGEFELI